MLILFSLFSLCIVAIRFLVVSFQKEPVPDDYDKRDPEHKHIYRFVRNLFNAAQLTAECAVVTLVKSQSP